jgi:Flp pilus assembly CpaF family ATPase
MGGLGFSLLEGRTERVLKRKGALPLYTPEGLARPLGEEDALRIGKILGAYQNLPEITETGEERRKIIGTLVDKYLKALGKKIPDGTAELYCRICCAASGNGLGPLDFLLEDPELEEIMVNGIGRPISIFHRKAGMCETNLIFDSAEYLVEKGNQILFPLNKRVDESRPSGHGILENGDRVTVAIPPLSREPCLDIRRFTEKPMTICDLVGAGMLDWKMASFLSLAMERGGANLGVIGNTGAGKTTFLGALLRLVPPHERIVAVEEIPEIKIPHLQQVRLLEVEHLGLRMADCILETLRLRPDRVIVGEVRSPADALALRDSCLSGQAFGTYFTYHAEDAAFAVERLASQGVGRKDLEAFNLLVCCKRFENERFETKRVVTEISEVGKEGEIVRLFSYDFESGEWECALKGRSKIEGWLGKISGGKLDIPAELKRREKTLSALSGKEDREFFGKLWGGK